MRRTRDPRRMIRGVTLACALAASLVGARAARADYNPSQIAPPLSSIRDSGPPLRRQHSPQTFAAQISFGPYRPDVDSEFDGVRSPYADYYGTGRHLLTQIEVDYQLYRGMGSLGVGLGAGLFRVSGTAKPISPSAPPTADQSTLTVIPVSVSAVYRFDYFLEQNGFPLVPHAKLGLDWAYWSVTDGNGEIATADGGRGRGGTLGWHAVIGAALVLDFIDPESAHDFDVETGVNHTALVFEYGHYDISGLGESNRLHVGDTTWTLGLLFEF